MFKTLKTALRAVIVIVVTASVRILEGRAAPGIEKFLQDGLRNLAERYVAITA